MNLENFNSKFSQTKHVILRFTEIECIEKTGTLVTGIYGTIEPQSSCVVPQKVRFRATETDKSPAWYKKELIQFITVGKPQNEIRCFYIPDSKNPQKNLLDQFHICG